MFFHEALWDALLMNHLDDLFLYLRNCRLFGRASKTHRIASALVLRNSDTRVEPDAVITVESAVDRCVLTAEIVTFLWDDLHDFGLHHLQNMNVDDFLHVALLDFPLIHDLNRLIGFLCDL